jgi:hypothetical protein
MPADTRLTDQFRSFDVVNPSQLCIFSQHPGPSFRSGQDEARGATTPAIAERK